MSKSEFLKVLYKGIEEFKKDKNMLELGEDYEMEFDEWLENLTFKIVLEDNENG